MLPWGRHILHACIDFITHHIPAAEVSLLDLSAPPLPLSEALPTLLLPLLLPFAVAPSAGAATQGLASLLFLPECASCAP